MDINSLDILPRKLFGREIKFYKKNDKIVYWNGYEVQCQHQKRKGRCPDCGGKSLCDHDLEKYQCRQCNGKAFCKHEKRKYFCLECKGKSFCKHDVRKSNCKQCKGRNICDHNLIRNTCPTCDPEGHLINLMRTRVRHALKGHVKHKHTIDYHGCTLKELRAYISKMFQEGMTWDNYGSCWHLDHIRPCSSFDLEQESEIEKCFQYTNLQPLFAEDNLKKGEKYDPETDPRVWDEELKMWRNK